MSAVVLMNTWLLADEFSGWWIGSVVLSLSIMVYFYQVKSKDQIIEFKNVRELRIGSISVSFQVAQMISKKVYFLFENFLTFISRLFEGAGGILWAVVFLALFMTILKFQGGI